MTTWRTERTGWRDAALSERHGHWGFNCPAVDLDFVMVEYNRGKPCAIVEYKHKDAEPVDPGHPSYRALVDLADGHRDGPIACIIARYDPDSWSFVVTPLNDKARKHYAHCLGQTLTEKRFVRSLYLLRKKILSEQDEAAINSLMSQIPSEKE